MGTSYIGTSGFYYAHWLKDFYPPGIKKEDLLSYYQQQFNTVEINSSFYHIPRASTIENWLAKVDEHFIFTFKASRSVTHLKKFNVDAKLIEAVFSPLKICENIPPKHVVLFQTPGNVKKNKEKLQHLFELLPKTFLYAFEFRHQTWFEDDIYEVMKKNNAAIVLSDSPEQHGERMWPFVDVDTASFFYMRFHGSPQLYYSSYSDEVLKDYAELMKIKMKKGMDVYAYFNNDAAGWAVQNAKKLKEFVEKE
jgi:uncharacterized protein YecE (DUF72 family)